MQQISFSKSNKKWTINCLICYLNLALLPIIIPLATKYAVTLIYDFYNLKIVSKNISAEYKKTNGLDSGIFSSSRVTHFKKSCQEYTLLKIIPLHIFVMK